MPIPIVHGFASSIHPSRKRGGAAPSSTLVFDFVLCLVGWTVDDADDTMPQKISRRRRRRKERDKAIDPHRRDQVTVLAVSARHGNHRASTC